MRARSPICRCASELRRNRHFIFGNWEGNRVRQGTGPFASNVPTAAQRAGTINYTSFTDANGNGRFDASEPTAPAQLNLAGRIAPISRAVLDVSGIGSGTDDLAQDCYNLRAQRGLSNYDIPHKFALSSTWAFPICRGRRFFSNAPPLILALISDWQVNSITTYQSGQPFTVTVGAFD